MAFPLWWRCRQPGAFKSPGLRNTCTPKVCNHQAIIFEFSTNNGFSLGVYSFLNSGLLEAMGGAAEALLGFRDLLTAMARAHDLNLGLRDLRRGSRSP